MRPTTERTRGAWRPCLESSRLMRFRRPCAGPKQALGFFLINHAVGCFQTNQDWDSTYDTHQCNAAAAASSDSVVLACTTVGGYFGDYPSTEQTDLVAVMLVSSIQWVQQDSPALPDQPHLTLRPIPFPSSHHSKAAKQLYFDRAVNPARSLARTSSLVDIPMC